MSEQPEVLTAEEAAAYLRVSMNTMRKLLRDGEIPAAKVGREWRIKRAALDTFLDGQHRQAAQQEGGGESEQ